MTFNAIVGKLNAFLAEPVDSECKAVYVLCEVRKLLEDTLPRDRPFALNMHCHWALHVDLHGKDTVRPFLQQVDAYVNTVIVGPEDILASNRMIREFIFLDTFRSELRDFFQARGIRTRLTDDDAWWNEFVKHYAGVIEDGSLSIKAENHGLTHVKEVTFTKGRDVTERFSLLPFDMVWSVSMLDGRHLDVEVSATDDAARMISWGVHLR
jgi:hypothetical protein